MSAALDYERSFWGDCLNTHGEESKQLVYASLMGIDFDLRGLKVIDIGSGPVSMLLKTSHRGSPCIAVDPLMDDFPAWVRRRYTAAGIVPVARKGEALAVTGMDEAWIYNVLQHVDDPAEVIRRARESAPVVRLFEWVGIPAYEGHPHELHAADLNEWLGGPGITQALNAHGAIGTAYYGCWR